MRVAISFRGARTDLRFDLTHVGAAGGGSTPLRGGRRVPRVPGHKVRSIGKRDKS